VYSWKSHVDSNELEKTLVRLQRRGPDGEGVWVAPNGNIALGHRRLAIIDLSPTGAQPMQSPDGRYVITFNGEIYNYRTLRDELQTEGYTFRSESDTEVLLALYALRGATALDRLRGMYAFAIWDTHREHLFLARDPFGIKPLYYAAQTGALRFASQVRALVSGGNVSRELDPAGCVGFLMYGSVPEPFSTFRDIQSLPAGHSLEVDKRGRQTLRRHFSVAAELRTAFQDHGRSRQRGEHHDQVAVSLRDSVRHHLVSDVPVGAFLSGGIDSGVVVALMRERDYEVNTVTLGFPEFRGGVRDETELARETAMTYGTKHHTQWVTQADVRDSTEEFLEAMDQPSIDGLNTWLVSRVASERGLKVVLSGLGGDEIFGGYPSFRQIPRLVCGIRALGRLPDAANAWRRLSEALPGRHSPKLPGLVAYGSTYEGAYLLRRGLFLPDELSALGVFPSDFIAEGMQRLAYRERLQRILTPDPCSDFGRVATLETCMYMRNQLLRDADWASMWHGLEIRVPLVDVPVFRAAAATLTRSPTMGSKQNLLDVPHRALPTRVGTKKKTGFGLPIERTVEDESSPLSAWRRLPTMSAKRTHWARKLACTLMLRLQAPESPST